MADKPITNQRSKEEIRSEVAKIDAEVPEAPEFVKIMENKEPEAETPQEDIIETPVEDTQSEDGELVEDEQFEVTEEESPVEEAPVEEKPKLPSPEVRARESGQEAMILHSKNKKIMETIDEAEALPAPTNEELTAYAKEMGENYEDLDTFAQNILKESLMNKRRFAKISSLAEEERQVAKWVSKIEEFVEREDVAQQYPLLASQSEDFIKYASKRSHIGADLDLLVAGFLWKNPVQKHQGSVLLPSSKKSGNTSQAKPTEPSEDDARVVRTQDPKKYKQMIKSRKFKITV